MSAFFFSISAFFSSSETSATAAIGYGVSLLFFASSI